MLEENGRLLRIARETMGLSYAEVEEATKVREYYLQLLEEGDLAGLPGRIYAVGFAETYAKFLGLSPEPIVEDIKAYYAENSANTGFEAYVSGKKVVQAVAEGGAFTPEARYKAESHMADKNTKAEAANQLRASAYANVALGRPIRTRNRSFGKRFLWVLLGSAVVALLVVLYLLQDNPQLPGFFRGENPPPVAENDLQTEAALITLIVTAGDETVWLGVNCDGTDSQITLEPGISQAFTGSERIYLRFNKATHTEVIYNGETLTDFSLGQDIWNMNFYPDSYEGFGDTNPEPAEPPAPTEPAAN